MGDGFSIYRGCGEDLKFLYSARTMEEIWDFFQEYIKEKGIIMSYRRMWRRPTDESVLVIDYGLYTDFFYIKAENGQRIEI